MRFYQLVVLEDILYLPKKIKYVNVIPCHRRSPLGISVIFVTTTETLHLRVDV